MNRAQRRRAVRDLLKQHGGMDRILTGAAVAELLERDRVMLSELRQKLGDEKWTKLMGETLDDLAAKGEIMKIERPDQEPIFMAHKHAARFKPVTLAEKVEAKKKEVEEK